MNENIETRGENLLVKNRLLFASDPMKYEPGSLDDNEEYEYAQIPQDEITEDLVERTNNQPIYEQHNPATDPKGIVVNARLEIGQDNKKEIRGDIYLTDKNIIKKAIEGGLKGLSETYTFVKAKAKNGLDYLQKEIEPIELSLVEEGRLERSLALNKKGGEKMDDEDYKKKAEDTGEMIAKNEEEKKDDSISVDSLKSLIKELIKEAIEPKKEEEEKEDEEQPQEMVTNACSNEDEEDAKDKKIASNAREIETLKKKLERNRERLVLNNAEVFTKTDDVKKSMVKNSADFESLEYKKKYSGFKTICDDYALGLPNPD